MFKLLTVGVLVAAIAVPASAAGKGIRPHHARAQIACPQGVVILPGRGYGICGGGFYVRSPQTGQLKAIPFWRLLRQNNPNEDRP